MNIGVGTALRPQKWASWVEAFPQVLLEYPAKLDCGDRPSWLPVLRRPFWVDLSEVSKSVMYVRELR